MRVLNPAVDASSRPFARMPAALTKAADSVPVVTVRADTVLAVRRSRLAPPAVTVPVAATEPAVTAPVDAIFAARSAPFTVSDTEKQICGDLDGLGGCATPPEAMPSVSK